MIQVIPKKRLLAAFLMAVALWLSPERLSAQGGDGYLFDWTESSVGNPYGGDACYYDGMPGGFEWFFDDVVSLFELTWGDIGDLGDWLRGESGPFSGAFTHQSFGSDYEGLFSHQSFGSDYEGLFSHQSFGSDYEGLFSHQSFGSDYEGLFSHQSFGSDYEGGFIHQSFGGEAPLGSGLLVLLSAGMGYAAWKRKKQQINKEK